MVTIDREKIAIIFKSYPFILAAYQFGSTIRGQEKPFSDLDIAILVDEERSPSGIELLRFELLLSYKIQKHLSVPEVDLITLNHQRLPFQYTVLRKGKLIYDTGSSFRVHFVQRVVRDYLDFEPTLRFIDRFKARGLLTRCDIR